MTEALPHPTDTPDRDTPLLDILQALKRANYRFVTPTPATHALVSGRRQRARSGSLRDVFGWNRPFSPGDIDGDLLRALDAAGVVRPESGGLLRLDIRVASVDDRLYLH